jgi:hypothetical protein
MSSAKIGEISADLDGIRDQNVTVDSHYIAILKPANFHCNLPSVRGKGKRPKMLGVMSLPRYILSHAGYALIYWDSPFHIQLEDIILTLLFSRR